MSANPDAFPKMLEDAVETGLAREEQVNKKKLEGRTNESTDGVCEWGQGAST